MKKIITISREFGAGGGQIGRAVADRLGYYYLDKDMIVRSAMESANLTPEDFRKWDERVPLNLGFGESLFDFYNKPLNAFTTASTKGCTSVSWEPMCICSPLM